MAGLMGQILTRSLTVRGFIQSEFTSSHGRDFVRDMGEWVGSGQVRYREDVVDGLENAPAAFAGMLRGRELRQARGQGRLTPGPRPGVDGSSGHVFTQPS